jgi:multidrug efflux pump
LVAYALINIIFLKNFKERYGSAERARKENAVAVFQQVAAKAQEIDAGRLMPLFPAAIPGIGTTDGFEFWIQDKASGDPARLNEITQQFLAKARTRPEPTGLNTTFRAASQQLRAEVDRSKAVLREHPVNLERRSRGETEATMIWLFWCSGKHPKCPPFNRYTESGQR